jgi:hypothetical protein
MAAQIWNLGSTGQSRSGAAAECGQRFGLIKPQLPVTRS